MSLSLSMSPEGWPPAASPLSRRSRGGLTILATPMSLMEAGMQRCSLRDARPASLLERLESKIDFNPAHPGGSGGSENHPLEQTHLHTHLHTPPHASTRLPTRTSTPRPTPNKASTMSGWPLPAPSTPSGVEGHVQPKGGLAAGKFLLDNKIPNSTSNALPTSLRFARHVPFPCLHIRVHEHDHIHIHIHVCPPLIRQHARAHHRHPHPALDCNYLRQSQSLSYTFLLLLLVPSIAAPESSPPCSFHVLNISTSTSTLGSKCRPHQTPTNQPGKWPGWDVLLKHPNAKKNPPAHNQRLPPILHPLKG